MTKSNTKRLLTIGLPAFLGGCLLGAALLQVGINTIDILFITLWTMCLAFVLFILQKT